MTITSTKLAQAIQAAITVTPTRTSDGQGGMTSNRADDYMSALCEQLAVRLFKDNRSTKSTQAKWRARPVYSRKLNRDVWAYNGPIGYINNKRVEIVFYFDDGTTGYVMCGYQIRVFNERSGTVDSRGRVSIPATQEFTDGMDSNRTLIPAVIRHVYLMAEKPSANNAVGEGDTFLERARYCEALEIIGGYLNNNNWGCFTQIPEDVLKKGNTAGATLQIVDALHVFAEARVLAKNRDYPINESSLKGFVEDVMSGDKTGEVTIIGTCRSNILNPKGAEVSIKEALENLGMSVTVQVKAVAVSQHKIEMVLILKG